MLVKVQLFGEYVFGSKTRRVSYKTKIYAVDSTKIVRCEDSICVDDTELVEVNLTNQLRVIPYQR